MGSGGFRTLRTSNLPSWGAKVEVEAAYAGWRAAVFGAGTLVRVTLRLFDSLSRELRDFVPLQPGRVGIYICGLTTQAPPHIGHVRFAVAFDVLRRWLVRGHGYDVTLVRNVTDLDDKILRKSAESGEDWFALSYRNEVATSAGTEPARCPAADLRAPRDGPHHRDGRAHRAAHRPGSCLRCAGRLG